jgi:D-xylose transport system ATP-binding protein
MTALSQTPLLEVRNATKRFGAVTALDTVSFSLRHREVLALLGDNGAGKSTVIKALSGVHALDAGEVLIEGEPVVIRSPHDARSLGIETVYQDLALFDNLSAAENMFSGRELSNPRALGPLGLVRRRAMRRKTGEALERLQIGIKDPDLEVGLMSGGQRQAVAVARAEAFASRVVILDEPTAALGVREAANVIRLIRRLPENGIAVILISHNLEQVMEVADRAIVLRQGRFAGEAIPSADNHHLLVSWIIGAQGANSNGPPAGPHNNRSDT